MAQKAGREAVIFPARHHRNEAWLVPCTTLIPVSDAARASTNASQQATMMNVTLAVFMGIGLALMSTFFIIERAMQPVVRYLLDNDVPIDFERLPTSHLRSRLNLCFGLIILITALMIGTLASQRAADIIQQPDNQKEAVDGLPHSHRLHHAGGDHRRSCSFRRRSADRSRRAWPGWCKP